MVVAIVLLQEEDWTDTGYAAGTMRYQECADSKGLEPARSNTFLAALS